MVIGEWCPKLACLEPFQNRIKIIGVRQTYEKAKNYFSNSFSFTRGTNKINWYFYTTRAH